MVTRYRIDFEQSVPSVERIAERFCALTGLDLAVEKFGDSSYSLSSEPLKGDVEIHIGAAIELIVFRLRRGYLEWALLWTLRSLGGQVPLRLIPKYAQAPWESLAWHERWLHR